MTVKSNWKGLKIKANERSGALQGLRKGAEHILEEATRIVPLQEGTLMRSGVVAVDETQLRASITYDTPYAVRQHEEMNYNHPLGRQAKYLETPMNSERDKVMEIIAQEIKESLRK